MQEHFDVLFSMRLRDVARQIASVGFFLSLVLVGWCCFTAMTNCTASIVVVLSGSMEPGYQRGDILLLHRRPEYPVQVGDIVVYSAPGKEIPIVHRVHRLYQRASDSKTLYLTKGDNNQHDDRFLFPAGMDWVEEDMIIGKSYAYIPRAGYLTIMFSESYVVKVGTLLLIGFLVLTASEEI